MNGQKNQRMSGRGQALLTEPLGLCFDIGNVLVFPDGDVLANLLTRALGRPFDPAKCRDAFLVADWQRFVPEEPLSPKPGLAFADAWARYLEIGEEEAASAWETVVRANRNGDRYWNAVDPEARPTLLHFQALGLKMSAVSNADGHLVEDMTEFGLHDVFTALLDSQVLGIEKPDPRIYLQGAAALGLAPDACWYIGDTASELYGARKAGIGTAVLYDPLDLYDDSHDYARVRSLAELRSLVGIARG